MKEKFRKWTAKRYSAKRRIIALIPAGALFLILIPLFVVLLAQPIDMWLGLPKFVQGALNFIAALLFVIPGLSLAVWSVWAQFVMAEGTPSPLMPTRRLVVKGPYIYCRNPMILGTTIFYLGIGIMQGSFSSIGLVTLVGAILLAYVKLFEEKELEARFGRGYLEYKRRTPFIIPRKKS